jgi:Trk-type K+ transport system membrane component
MHAIYMFLENLDIKARLSDKKQMRYLKLFTKAHSKSNIIRTIDRICWVITIYVATLTLCGYVFAELEN